MNEDWLFRCSYKASLLPAPLGAFVRAERYMELSYKLREVYNHEANHLPWKNIHSG